MRTKKNKSIFSAILIAFLLVVMPVYAAGYLAYRWGITRLRNEIALSQSAQTRYYMQKFHSDIQRTIKQQSSVSSDRDVIMLSAFGEDFTEKNYPSIETMLAINRIQARLTTIMDSNDIIENVTIHMPSINKSIHSIGSISDLTPEAYLELKNIYDKREEQVLFKDNVPISIVTSPFQYASMGRLPAYIVEVEYSIPKIFNTLKLMKGDLEGGIALVQEKLNLMIAGTGDANLVWGLLEDNKVKPVAVDSEPGSYPGSVDIRKYNGVKYLVAIGRDTFTGLTLVSYTPVQEIYRPLQKYQPYFWTFTLVLAVFAVMFLYIFYREIKKPLVKLIHAFRMVDDDNLDVRVEYRQQNEFKYLFDSFNSMIDRIKNLIEQVYKQKILYQKAELKQLQSQINPHFLYNSYFVLRDMAENQDCEGLAEYTKLMGTYFQYITRNSGQSATLSQEVEHARIYAMFQERRFRNRMKLIFGELPQSMCDQVVPKVVLQPLIENAFEHGLKNTVKDGILRVSFKEDTHYCRIFVEDNGKDLSDESLEELSNNLNNEDNDIEQTGLINIHRRIRLSFGLNSGIYVSRSELGGLCVEMRIEKPGGGNNVQVADC
ncbi:MAG TPA: histidine kinase [Clostridiaceae bacterium]|nr:histidine kinase [Clostridiaceae bacterium]